MVDSLELAKEFILSRPDFAASTLEDQSPETAAAFLRELPDDLAGTLLSRLMPTYAGHFLEELDPKTSAALLADVSADVSSAILRHTRADRRPPILDQMPTKAAGACRHMLRYGTGTVGSCMDSRVFVLPDDVTVENSIHRMRQSPERTSGQIFVVGRNGHLRGVLQVWDIVRARHDAPVSALTVYQRETLPVRAPLGAAAKHPAWRETNELPVVETNGSFIGILRHLRMRNVLRVGSSEDGESQAGETMMEMGVDAWESAAELLETVITVATTPDQSRKDR